MPPCTIHLDQPYPPAAILRTIPSAGAVALSRLDYSGLPLECGELLPVKHHRDRYSYVFQSFFSFHFECRPTYAPFISEAQKWWAPALRISQLQISSWRASHYSGQHLALGQFLAFCTLVSSRSTPCAETYRCLGRDKHQNHLRVVFAVYARGGKSALAMGCTSSTSVASTMRASAYGFSMFMVLHSSMHTR